jgi:hypothetical protein
MVVTREDNCRPLQYGGIAVSEAGQVKPRQVAPLTAARRLRVAKATDVDLYWLGAGGRGIQLSELRVHYAAVGLGDV